MAYDYLPPQSRVLFKQEDLLSVVSIFFAFKIVSLEEEF